MSIEVSVFHRLSNVLVPRVRSTDVQELNEECAAIQNCSERVAIWIVTVWACAVAAQAAHMWAAPCHPAQMLYTGIFHRRQWAAGLLSSTAFMRNGKSTSSCAYGRSGTERQRFFLSLDSNGPLLTGHTHNHESHGSWRMPGGVENDGKWMSESGWDRKWGRRNTKSPQLESVKWFRYDTLS